MERLCEKCGSLVSGDVKFCPVCGEPMKSAVDLGKTDAMPPVQQSYGNQPVNQQNNGYSAPQYGQNIAPSNNAQNQTMTMGQWVGTILLCTFLGTISLILNLVWGFSSSTPEPKRSYCRAMLIVYLITVALTLIMTVIMLVFFREFIFEFLNEYESTGLEWRI